MFTTQDGNGRRLHLAAIATLAMIAMLGTGCTTDSAPTAANPSPVPSAASSPTVPVPPTVEVSPTATPPATPPTAPTGTPTRAQDEPTSVPIATVTRTGAGSLVDQDLAPLHNQRVGLIAHQASVVDGRPLAVWFDEHPLVDLVALFAPEHGLYGEADAGAAVSTIEDPLTGTPVYSLYGNDRSPTASALSDIDVLVYDLQDVGVRFYTYTSTLGLAMQAAAAADVDFVVLDRPNPLGGDRLQGPTLTSGLESFIGLYNLPSAYGLTAGELATLIKSEQLLPGLEDLSLAVVPMQGWIREMRWIDTGLEWIAPSPNLPTPESALVYPGTVLFEATSISEGRGTDEPFTLIGAPWIDGQALADALNARKVPGVQFEPATFTPRSIPGAAVSPRFLGEEIVGVHILVTDAHLVAGVEVGLVVLDAILRHGERRGLDPASIIDRPDVFDRLAGTAAVRRDLVAGTSIDEILASFTSDHQAFAELSAASLLYE